MLIKVSFIVNLTKRPAASIIPKEKQQKSYVI